MSKFEHMKGTVCYEVWRDGWVTDEELQGDTEFSDNWPMWLRNIYYHISDDIVWAGRRNPVIRMYAWGLSYCYIKFTNHMHKGHYIRGVLNLVPVGLNLIPGVLIGGLCYLVREYKR